MGSFNKYMYIFVFQRNLALHKAQLLLSKGKLLTEKLCLFNTLCPQLSDFAPQGFQISFTGGNFIAVKRYVLLRNSFSALFGD